MTMAKLKEMAREMATAIMSVLKKIAGFSAKIYEQTTKLQKIYTLIGLVVLFALYVFWGGGGGGAEYVGKWKNVTEINVSKANRNRSQAMTTVLEAIGSQTMTNEVEITHTSGKQYSLLIRSNHSMLGNMGEVKALAEYQNGGLKCSTGYVIQIDKKTDELNIAGIIYTRQ